MTTHEAARYTPAKIEVIRHLFLHSGLSLKQAIQRVKEMSEEELQAKREQIAQHTNR